MGLATATMTGSAMAMANLLGRSESRRCYCGGKSPLPKTVMLLPATIAALLGTKMVLALYATLK